MLGLHENWHQFCNTIDIQFILNPKESQMKKVLSTIVAAIVALSFSAVVFAADAAPAAAPAADAAPAAEKKEVKKVKKAKKAKKAKAEKKEAAPAEAAAPAAK
jgi:mannitol-specific phosphotransferase system IIBC component